MAELKPNLVIVTSMQARSESSSSLLRLLRDNVNTLKKYTINTTRGTGERLYGAGLLAAQDVQLYKPGRSGGISQLAALVARKQCVAAILLLDPNDPWSDAVENRTLKRVLIALRVRLMTTYEAAQRWLVNQAAGQAARFRPPGTETWKPKNWEEGESNVVESHRRSTYAHDLEEGESAIGNYLHLPIAKRTIALISHEQMMIEMLRFVNDHAREIAAHHRLLIAGTTGWVLKLLFSDKTLESELIAEVDSTEKDIRINDMLNRISQAVGWYDPTRTTHNHLAAIRQRLALTSAPEIPPKILQLPSVMEGGDALIADQVVANRCHSIISFHDPRTAHPHNDDIRLLEHVSHLPGVVCEFVSDSQSAESWLQGLEAEFDFTGMRERDPLEKVRQANALTDPGDAQRTAPEAIDRTPAHHQYDFFISYAAGDAHIAADIKVALERSGLRCFMAAKSIKVATRWEEEIASAIRASSRLILLLTPRSVRRPWVLMEAGAAWVLGKELIPVLNQVRPHRLLEPIRSYQARVVETPSQLDDLLKELRESE